MIQYVILFVIFAGFAFTTTGVHPFPVKSVTLILMVVLDIATNLDVGYTKTNKDQKMTAGDVHRRLKFFLLEVAFQHALQSDTVTGLAHCLFPVIDRILLNDFRTITKIVTEPASMPIHPMAVRV